MSGGVVVKVVAAEELLAFAHVFLYPLASLFACWDDNSLFYPVVSLTS